MYGPSLCKFWYRLYFGDHNYDLYPEEMGDQPEWRSFDDEAQVEANALVPVRDPPEWWGWWLNDFDLNTAMNFSYSDDYVEEAGRRWHQPWRNWALTNGVAPGQLFCIDVPEPTVTKSGWETIEYDEEWDAQLLEVIPMSRQCVAARWEADLWKTTRARAQHMLYAKHNAELVDRDIASMYINQMLYCPSTKYQADWQVPTGKCLSLETKNRLYPRAANSIGTNGRSDAGDFNKAMEELIVNACKANPYLSPDLIRSLEIRR